MPNIDKSFFKKCCPYDEQTAINHQNANHDEGRSIVGEIQYSSLIPLI